MYPVLILYQIVSSNIIYLKIIMERSSRSSKVLVDDKEKIFGEGNENIQWFGKMMKKHAQKVIDANNISNCSAEELAKCKFTFLEPSPAEEMLQQLQKKGQQFVDQSFPANKASLDGNYPYPDQKMAALWPSIQWRKISEVLPQSKIFKGDIEPNDIQQGSLGDCYFLAALSALAERQYRIFNLFLLKEVNNVKYYSVRILYRGKWMTIDLDEYIPWLNLPQYGYDNRPAFAKTSQNQLWVILLEKAYAKLYGCFTKINGGSPLEPLQAMTGGNPVRLEFKSNQQIQENWRYLEQATRLHYPMVAASHGQGETIGNTGIVAGHAYTLLSVWTINGRDRVVKLRNPWGNQEWQGQWNDGDNNSWSQVNQSQKNRIGFKNAQDGIFFMPYLQFVKFFVNVELVQMNDNYSYVYKSIAGNYPKGIYFKIKIPKQGKYSIQNYTTPHRKIYPPGQMPTSFSISYLNMLYRLSDRQPIRLEAKFGSAMNYAIYTLTPGQYLYHTIQKFDQYEKEFEINVAVYSEYAAEIKIATPQEVGQIDRFCNWNPPQLQEQYRADNQAQKQSNNTGLTSKEAEKLAALERLKNMGGNNQVPQNNVVPEKKVVPPQPPQPQPKPQPPVPKIPENQGWNNNGWDDPRGNQGFGFGGNGGNMQPFNQFNNQFDMDNGWNDNGWNDNFGNNFGNQGNQGNQDEWTLISTNQQTRSSINHFGQKQTVTKITKVYRNRQGDIMQDEQIISQVEDTAPQGFGWSNKYQFW